MDIEIRIEFCRKGDEEIEGSLEGITIPHVLAYMPEVGLGGPASSAVIPPA